MKMSYWENKLLETYRKLSDKDQEFLYRIALSFLSENSADSNLEKRLILRTISSILTTGRNDLKPTQAFISYYSLTLRTVDLHHGSQPFFYYHERTCKIVYVFQDLIEMISHFEVSSNLLEAFVAKQYVPLETRTNIPFFTILDRSTFVLPVEMASNS